MVREIVLLRRLQDGCHPNIVRLFNFFHADETLHIVMEFLPHTLQTYPHAKARALALIEQLCNAVSFCHQNQVMHRDIKPENVLVDAGGRLRLSDFGLATIMPRRCYTMNVVTLPYRAPELLIEAKTGLYTVGIDWWSVGCVCYELVYGVLLFDGVQTIDELRDRITRFQPPHVPDSEVRKCLSHLLQTDPMARIPLGCAQSY